MITIKITLKVEYAQAECKEGLLAKLSKFIALEYTNLDTGIKCLKN